jgi:hypothetical protein
MVRARPQTRRAKLIRKRRCPKCNAALNTQVKRCKKCAAETPFSVPGKLTPKAFYRTTDFRSGDKKMN